MAEPTEFENDEETPVAMGPTVTIDVGLGPGTVTTGRVQDIFIGADDIADDDTEPPEAEELEGELHQLNDEEFEMDDGQEIDEAIPFDLQEDDEEQPASSRPKDEYEGMDDNEIAAQALEAELCGDAELAAKLNGALQARQEFMLQEMQREGKELKPRREPQADDKEKGKSKGKGKGKGKDGKSGKGKRRGANHAPGEDPGGGAGGMAGEAGGICKWFAAGFCRNRTEGGKCCNNGIHDSSAAQAAEAAWVAEGPTAGSAPSAAQPVLLILDFEGGGNVDGPNGEDELIEVPVMAVCPATGRELGRFHRFARPSYWDLHRDAMRRQFRPECFNDASTAMPFPQVLTELREWICQLLALQSDAALTNDHFLFVTCGNWDVKTAMPRQCSKPVPGTVEPGLQQLMCQRWCNLKEVFREHKQLEQGAAPTGMRGMLRHLRIPLSGQHHLGMDDVSNLGKIVKKLISEAAPLQPTGFARLQTGKGSFMPMVGGFAGSQRGMAMQQSFPPLPPAAGSYGKGLKGRGDGKGKTKGKGKGDDKGKGEGKSKGDKGKTKDRHKTFAAAGAAPPTASAKKQSAPAFSPLHPLGLNRDIGGLQPPAVANVDASGQDDAAAPAKTLEFPALHSTAFTRRLLAAEGMDADEDDDDDDMEIGNNIDKTLESEGGHTTLLGAGLKRPSDTAESQEEPANKSQRIKLLLAGLPAPKST